MKNPFLHRLMKDNKKDILHSSAYARVRNGGNMGSDSVESFAARRAVDAKRRAVRGYNESRMVGESGVRAMGARQSKKEGSSEEIVSKRSFDKKVDNNNKDANRASGQRRFVEPNLNRPAAKPPVRRNPGVSR